MTKETIPREEKRSAKIRTYCFIRTLGRVIRHSMKITEEEWFAILRKLNRKKDL